MQAIGTILKKFDPTKDKYISREFQAFGVHLAEELNDTKHKSLYTRTEFSKLRGEIGGTPRRSGKPFLT